MSYDNSIGYSTATRGAAYTVRRVTYVCVRRQRPTGTMGPPAAGGRFGTMPYGGVAQQCNITLYHTGLGLNWMWWAAAAQGSLDQYLLEVDVAHVDAQPACHRVLLVLHYHRVPANVGQSRSECVRSHSLGNQRAIRRAQLPAAAGGREGTHVLSASEYCLFAWYCTARLKQTE
jgi:hypothetical protein